MENTFRKFSLSFALATSLILVGPTQAEVLKLAEAPLSEIIALYSKATGKNIFVDDTVQQQRKVTAHLQDMTIEEAFGIVQKTLGLESCMVGTNTILLYPPERAQRYQPEMKSRVLHTPSGIDSKWFQGTINTLVPGVKTTPATGDQREFLLFGPDAQVDQARAVTRKMPEMAAKQKFWAMVEHESMLAIKEMKSEDVILEVQSNGLTGHGSGTALKQYGEKLLDWRMKTQWDEEVYTPEYLDGGKLLRAAEVTKGRSLIADLGGTGSLLIEGPKNERMRVIRILQQLDQQAQKQQQGISLGEMKPEMAREAAKAMGVESVGDRNMVLVGRTG
ncbi:MAG: hypothetical protein HQM09_24190, partial [Candidatus Riflebacteria bacterium]|nr:hypothetical protein [Candidatus Riflebacteria bacterium]